MELDRVEADPLCGGGGTGKGLDRVGDVRIAHGMGTFSLRNGAFRWRFGVGSGSGRPREPLMPELKSDMPAGLMHVRHDLSPASRLAGSWKLGMEASLEAAGLPIVVPSVMMSPTPPSARRR